MVNFLSSDITRLEYFLIDLHYIWIAPIQVVLIIYFTYSEVGWAVIMGMLVFVLFVPLQSKFLQQYRVLRLVTTIKNMIDRRLICIIIDK